MKELDGLLDRLNGLAAFGNGDRVFLVTVPADYRTWPACVVARDGGAETGFAGPGQGAQIQSVRIAVVGDAEDYTAIEDAMEAVRAVVDDVAFGLIDPPDDVWNDTLQVIQQTIRVNLLP